MITCYNFMFVLVNFDSTVYSEIFDFLLYQSMRHRMLMSSIREKIGRKSV